MYSPRSHLVSFPSNVLLIIFLPVQDPSQNSLCRCHVSLYPYKQGHFFILGLVWHWHFWRVAGHLFTDAPTPPRSGFVPGVPVIREAAWFGQEHCIWRVLPSLGASAGGTRHLFLVDVVPTRFFLLQVILPFVIGNLCGDALRDSMYTVPHWSHP